MALPRIKEEAGNVEMKFPKDLTNMLEDHTHNLSRCEGSNKNGYVLATVKDLQEVIDELINNKVVPKC